MTNKDINEEIKEKASLKAFGERDYKIVYV